MKDQTRNLQSLSDQAYTEINRLNALLRTISRLSVFENDLGSEVEDAHQLIQMAEKSCGAVADQVHALDNAISRPGTGVSNSSATSPLPGERMLSLLKLIGEGKFDEEWAEALIASMVFFLEQAPNDAGFFEVAEYLKELIQRHGYDVAVLTGSANGEEKEAPLSRAAALSREIRQTEQNA